MLRKSRSVWSDIPPWTIRIFPSMMVAMGRRLNTSWNSWRISQPCIYQPQYKNMEHHSDPQAAGSPKAMYVILTLYFCITSFVNPYLEGFHHSGHQICVFTIKLNNSPHLFSLTWGSLGGPHGSLGSGACSRGKAEGRQTGAPPLQRSFSRDLQNPH